MRTNKSCGDLLVLGWLRQQIARQLLDGERIKGLVLIDGIHHPIAVLPHPAFVVEMKTMGVRVACGVQPDPAQMLSRAAGMANATSTAFSHVSDPSRKAST